MRRRRFTALAASLLAGSVSAGGSLAHSLAPRDGGVPTLRHTRASGASLLFIGTRHTFSPHDPQLEQLRSLINGFAPTIALVEGGNWPIELPHATIVQRYGEMAYVARVARDRGATLVSADPPFSDEIRIVGNRFGIVTTKLFYILRMVPQTLRASSEHSAEHRLVAWMNSAQLNVTSSMQEVLTTLDELDAEIRKIAPKLRTWRTASDPNVTAPTVNLSLMNEVARASVTYREEFITKKVAETLAPGTRVLLVMGGSHLENMQPTFKANLNRMGLSVKPAHSIEGTNNGGPGLGSLPTPVPPSHATHLKR